MNKSQIENWLESKIKTFHKKAFLPITYTFFGSIILGVVVRVFFTPHVPLTEVHGLPRVLIECARFAIMILAPIGLMLAILGLKRDWVEKPEWFKKNFKL